LKKLWHLYSLLVISTGWGAGPTISNYLSEEKNLIFDYESRINSLRSSMLRKSWINPINISYTLNYAEGSISGDYDEKLFRIGIDQPIFKSGGIYYAIRYANASEKANLGTIALEKKKMMADALSILYSIEKVRLQKRQLRLLIENDSIDIRRKEEQYEAGLIDSSFLDQAIIQRNRDRTSLLALELNEEKLRESFRLLSDENPDGLELPTLELIEKRDYIASNLELENSRYNLLKDSYDSKMRWAKYLPTLSLYASYNDQEHDFANMKRYRDDFTNFGVRISMPLSVNSPEDIEEGKVNYLKSAVKLQDDRKRVENEYDMLMKTLKLIDEKIALANSDAKLYRRLLRSTRERIEAGSKTKLDAEVLENSLKMAEIDAQVYRIEKQIQLLKLYEKVRDR
jgi:outer membrane protein TolC